LKKYRRFGLLAVLLVTSLVLASSCVGVSSGESEQENSEQGTEEGAEDNDGQSSTQTMGSFDEDKPFDLQFIDQMIIHHQGAIMSAEHMIAGPYFRGTSFSTYSTYQMLRGTASFDIFVPIPLGTEERRL
jgi:hypothetical protein